MKIEVDIPEDNSKILALLSATFRTPITPADWEWFTHRSPDGVGRTYMLKDKEDVVGSFSFQPMRIWMGEQLHKASTPHHLAIRQDHRNVKNFMALSHHAIQAEREEGVRLLITAANPASYQPHKTLMGWEDFSRVNCLHKTSLREREHGCQEIESFGIDFDTFYQGIVGKLEFCLHKTSAWMNWRFCDRPRKPYTIYTYGEGELLGYVVLKRWAEDEYVKAHVIDIHALNDIALSNLIAAAESYAVGCSELDMWAGPGFYPFEDYGFTIQKAQPVIVWPFDKSLHFPVNWGVSYSYGDGDGQY